MKALAAVLHEMGSPMSVEEVEVLPPKRGEVQVRMQAAGVCHSDLHVIKGDLPMPVPIIPGHEGSGIVEAVGEGVTELKEGDHVLPMWRMSCGRCEYCLSGRPALCDVGTAMRFTGLMPDGETRFRSSKGEPIRHYAGISSFAQLCTIPEPAVVKVPKEFSLEKGALISCGVITGFGAVFNTAQVKVGSTVAVFGCGGIGLNIVQSARIAGALRIIAVDRVPLKLEFAKKFGATDVIQADEDDPVDAIMDLTNNLGVDYAFEAIGLPQPIEQAYDSTRKGGTCVVVGIAPKEARARINVNALVYAEKTLKGTIYGSMRPRIDLPRLIELNLAGKLELDGLLTKTYPLEEINTAYEELEQGVVARSLILPNGAF